MREPHPGVLRARVQLAGWWPAPSGGPNYSQDPPDLKVQKEGAAPLIPVHLV